MHAALRAGPVDDRADRPREPLPVRGRADHELVERLLGVEHDQAAGRDPAPWIEPPRGQLRDEGPPVLLRGDDDGRRVHRQAVRQKVDDGGLEQIFALVELDDVRQLVVVALDGCGRFQRHFVLPIGDLLDAHRASVNKLRTRNP